MVPAWDLLTDTERYPTEISKLRTSDHSLALYIHIPFCHSLCYYCGCHTVIRTLASPASEVYLSSIFKEIDCIHPYLGGKKSITQLHLGGGSPNFLTETQIKKLIEKLNSAFSLAPSFEMAIECDPRLATSSKLALFKQLGFNRISFGIQDFDPNVQKAIHRIQPFTLVETLYQECRTLAFDSINFDLVYGLPHQSQTSFAKTIERVIQLKPDRIALFSYAHVPWMKKHQKLIDTHALPSPYEKLNLFLFARQAFFDAGYEPIGMDHFALPNDALVKAYKGGYLHRNCMGYTTGTFKNYLGLGVSSIGSLGNTYFQNHHHLKTYTQKLSEGILPVERVKSLTQDDIIRQWVIQQLMCYFSIDKKEFYKNFKVNFDDYFREAHPHIEASSQQNLITSDGSQIKVSELGKIFIRNICAGFDIYLQKNQSGKYSKAI